MNFNPAAINFWLFCTVLGYIFGRWDIGLAIGLGITLLAEMLPKNKKRF